MERLRHDDPPRIGPFTLLGRLDADSQQAVPARRFIARGADGDRTFLVSLPRVGADPSRWSIEAEGARRLALPGLQPVEEVGGAAGLPWSSSPYVPVLPLPAALLAHGGPLPEHVVRALGAAVARTLTTAHTHGVTHAGLSPDAVLLTTEGPRLGCFGAVRAAAPDGERRGGLPGLDSGALAPEQADGGRPRPLGDVYGLGAVLAYAATGHTVPERGELPPALAELITACLSRDPARRPRAQQLLTQLESPTSGPLAQSAAPATVLDTAAPIPLPAAVVTALARQSAHVLAAELPPTASLPRTGG
ncbi:serine/threonine protein kinase [Streptomyces niveus]